MFGTKLLKNWLDFMYIVSGLERGNCLHEDLCPCIWGKIQALVLNMVSKEDQYIR